MIAAVFMFASLQGRERSSLKSYNRSALQDEGATQFTETSWAVSFFPSDLVKLIMAAVEAEYAAMFGFPSLPATEAILTMRP